MTIATRSDAIVIGAGIVGAACARALAREGLRVLVLDAGFAAGGTTAAGMGHLVAMDDSAEQLALTAHSLSLWQSLRHSLPASVEYDACGTIWVAEDGEQLEAVAEKRRVYEEHAIASEVLDARRLYALEPNLRSGLAGGLLVPADSVIYPPRAALALLADAQTHGAVLREQCRVDDIVDHGVRIGGETLHANVIVNAAGAESGRLTPELPIVPRKGHLAITDRHPGFCRHQLVELGYLASAHVLSTESVAFNVQPRATGQVLIGSSRELVGWDAATNRGVLGQMLERAVEFMPMLARMSIVRTWTGFRAATPDKLPLIGRWLPIQGLYVATGHEGLGITTSLGTASLLADLVLGRTPVLDAAAYSPMRVLAAPAAAR